MAHQAGAQVRLRFKTRQTVIRSRRWVGIMMTTGVNASHIERRRKVHWPPGAQSFDARLSKSRKAGTAPGPRTRASHLWVDRMGKASTPNWDLRFRVSRSTSDRGDTIIHTCTCFVTGHIRDRAQPRSSAKDLCRSPMLGVGALASATGSTTYVSRRP